MSFKLVGDQYRELNLVQKRRVAELLVSNIPEEEALLMKNGRYVCLVCRHRPIFDTIAMLSVHRTGQRHIRAAHSVLRQKQNDREEREKRDQLKQLKKRVQQTASHGDGEDATPPPLLAQTRAATSSALLPGAPYSSLSTPLHKETLRGGEGDKQQPFFTRKRLLVAAEECEGSSKKICADRSVKPSSSHDEKCLSEDKASPQYVFPWNAETKKTITGNKDDASSQKLTDDKEHLAKSEKMKLIQLRSSGWIQNVDGSWSKDPAVEFDSEEDEST